MEERYSISQLSEVFSEDPRVILRICERSRLRLKPDLIEDARQLVPKLFTTVSGRKLSRFLRRLTLYGYSLPLSGTPTPGELVMAGILELVHNVVVFLHLVEIYGVCRPYSMELMMKLDELTRLVSKYREQCSKKVWSSRDVVELRREISRLEHKLLRDERVRLAENFYNNYIRPLGRQLKFKKRHLSMLKRIDVWLDLLCLPRKNSAFSEPIYLMEVKTSISSKGFNLTKPEKQFIKENVRKIPIMVIHVMLEHEVARVKYLTPCIQKS